MDQTVNRISAKDFINKVLAGVALGIVVGLIPNAILGELFKALTPYHPIFATLNSVVVGIQFTVPVLVGVLIGMQFKLNPIQTVIVGTAAFVGSGAAIFKENAWVLTGIGDLINTMITASIAVLLILWIKDRLGSLDYYPPADYSGWYCRVYRDHSITLRQTHHIKSRPADQQLHYFTTDCYVSSDCDFIQYTDCFTYFNGGHLYGDRYLRPCLWCCEFRGRCCCLYAGRRYCARQ